MKEIVFNNDRLTDSDVDEVVVRTKAVIINDNKVTLGYCDKTYQFPGGHLEENESLEECLVREVKEETGIDISNSFKTLLMKTVYYSKNYHNSSKNRKNEVYFYVVKTDMKYDQNNISLTDREIEGNYVIKTIPLGDVRKVLLDSIKDNPINEVIVNEMIEVLNEYENIDKH